MIRERPDRWEAIRQADVERTSSTLWFYVYRTVYGHHEKV